MATTTSTITLDLDKPEIDIEEISTGTIIYIKGTTTDQTSGISSIRYRLDDGIWHLQDPDDGNFQDKTERFTISLSGLSKGTHNISFIVEDLAKNIGTKTITFEVKCQAITIIEPRNNEHIKGIVKVSAIAIDNTGYVVFEQRRNGSLTFSSIGTDTSQEQGWFVYWDTPKDEATYTIKASSYNDLNEFLGSDTIDVEVDNIAPWGTLTILPNPASRTIVGNVIGSLDIKSSLFEYGTLAIAYDNNYPFGFSLDISSFLSGTYTFIATMEDEVSNKGTTSATILIDNDLPFAKITHIDGVPLGTIALKGTVTIEFQAFDLTTGIIGTPTILIDGIGEFFVSSFNGRAGTYIWDTRLYPNGGHSLQIKIFDEAGNCGYSPLVQVVVNNFYLPVVISTPQKGEIVTGTITIRLSSFPDFTHYIAFSVSTDGTTYHNLGSNTNFIDGCSFPWQTTLFPDGEWIILASAYSNTNQLLGTDTIRIKVDNTPPKIEIKEPTANMPKRVRPNEIVNVFFRYTEENPRLIEIELQDGTKTLVKKIVGCLIEGEINTYEPIVIWPDIPEGSYTLFIRLQDGALSYGTDIEVNAIIVTKIPLDIEREGTITITPNPNSKLEVYCSNALLRGTASNKIVEIKIKYEDGRTELIPMIDYKFGSIISLNEGTNTFDVYFTDIAGNEGSITKTIIYIIPRVSGIISSNAGGIITNPNGSMIEIPSGAIIASSRISFNLVLKREVDLQGGDEINFLKAYHLESPSIICYEFFVNGGGYVFHKPVKITLVYDDSNWDKNLNGIRDLDEIDENQLKVFYYDEVSKEWIIVGGEVNPASNTVTFWVNHMSLFALGTNRASISTSSKLDVSLKRNPFKLGEDTIFNFNLPKPGRVYLRIFDLAGDLVREITNGIHLSQGRSSLTWNGLNDVGDRYVGSGIYIYQFRVEYDDGGKEEVIKPIGVVK